MFSINKMFVNESFHVKKRTNHIGIKLYIISMNCVGQRVNHYMPTQQLSKRKNDKKIEETIRHFYVSDISFREPFHLNAIRLG